MAYTIGQTITATTGTWSSPAAFSLSYQWQNSPDLITWTSISGKNNNTYTIQTSDTHKYIRCQVTATTSVASATANTPYIGPILYIAFVCQISLANPNAATQTWVDVTPYVKQFHINRSKQRQLQRFEAASLDITLLNLDRRFDTTYSGSPYYPNLLPLKQIRFGFVHDGVIFWEFTGYIERWPQVYQGPTYAEVDITAVDGFELINNHYLDSAYATLTTSQGSNRDLKYTAVQLGFVGNSTTLTYVNPGGTNALSVAVVGTAITVNLGTSGGSLISTANQVITAIQGSVNASALVTVALAPGSNGTGIVQALGVTALSGGTFVQQLSGSFISQIFSFLVWNGQTVISPGESLVQAQALPIDGSTHAIDQIYAASDTEDGQFFFDAQGRPTFLDRQALTSSTYITPQMTLTDRPDTTTTFGYQNVQPSLDKDLIYNDVRVTRTGGITQIAQDATSDSQYFTRSLSRSTLNTSDAEALNLAQALLNRLAQPVLRFQPVTLTPGENHEFWQALLLLDLLRVVTVIRTPPGAPDVISSDVAVIGIEIQGTAGPVSSIQWTLSIDPLSSQQFFILNDTHFGILNSNYLGY